MRLSSCWQIRYFSFPWVISGPNLGFTKCHRKGRGKQIKKKGHYQRTKNKILEMGPSVKFVSPILFMKENMEGKFVSGKKTIFACLFKLVSSVMKFCWTNMAKMALFPEQNFPPIFRRRSWARNPGWLKCCLSYCLTMMEVTCCGYGTLATIYIYCDTMFTLGAKSNWTFLNPDPYRSKSSLNGKLVPGHGHSTWKLILIHHFGPFMPSPVWEAIIKTPSQWQHLLCRLINKCLLTAL